LQRVRPVAGQTVRSLGLVSGSSLVLVSSGVGGGHGQGGPLSGAASPRSLGGEMGLVALAGEEVEAGVSGGMQAYSWGGWGGATWRCPMSKLLQITVWGNVAGTLDFSIAVGVLPSDTLAVAAAQVCHSMIACVGA